MLQPRQGVVLPLLLLLHWRWRREGEEANGVTRAGAADDAAEQAGQRDDPKLMKGEEGGQGMASGNVIDWPS